MKIALLGLALVAMAYGQSKFYMANDIVSVNMNSGQSYSSLDDLQNAIGLSSDYSLQAKDERSSSNGLVRQEVQISFKGVPIRIARLQASVDSHNKYTGTVSGYYPDIPSSFSVSSQQTDGDLKAALVDYINANDHVPSFVGTVTASLLQDFSSSKAIDIDVNSGEVSVVYYVQAIIDVPVSDGVYLRFPRAVIRACDLTVIKANLEVLKATNSNKCPSVLGGNLLYPGPSFGNPRQSSHKRCLKAGRKNGKCVYSNKYVSVLDAKGGFDRSNAEEVSFNCRLGPQDETNDGYSPSSDVFYNTQAFYRMLQDWGHLSRADTEDISVYVHYGDRYPNSFFDGRSVCFGDGAPPEASPAAIATFPFTTMEAVGHEMCHSLTNGFGNLQVGHESLVLHEAFSDICGKGANVFDTGSIQSWTFAEQILKSGGSSSLRRFDDPTANGASIDHLSNYNAHNDAYQNMGVYTKAFFTLVAVHGIRFEDAFEAMVHANQLYWSEETTLIDGACGVYRAASDLALNHQAFRQAFHAVGIDLSFCSLAGTRDAIKCSEDCDVVVRNKVGVSSHKSPTFRLKPCSEANQASITITSGNRCNLQMFKKDGGNDVLVNGSEYIDLSNGPVTVFLTASCETSVNLQFHFSN